MAIAKLRVSPFRDDPSKPSTTEGDASRSLTAGCGSQLVTILSNLALKDRKHMGPGRKMQVFCLRWKK